MYKEDMRLKKQKCRDNEKVDCGRPERLKKFRNAVKYGAIFVCISCEQRLFENGVTTVTEHFRQSVNSKRSGLFEECVTEEDQEIDGKKVHYICHTCKETMKRGKMPAMSVKNGLFLVKLDDPDTKLSEIENNLIAQNFSENVPVAKE